MRKSWSSFSVTTVGGGGDSNSGLSLFLAKTAALCMRSRGVLSSEEVIGKFQHMFVEVTFTTAISSDS